MTDLDLIVRDLARPLADLEGQRAIEKGPELCYAAVAGSGAQTRAGSLRA